MNARTIAPLVLIVLLLSAPAALFSQTGGKPLPPADTELGKLLPLPSSTLSTPEIEAERAKIWNSPAMLRARTWAQEYCQRSARITPEEAKEYMTELHRMTPTQMKLWLLKFNHEEESVQRQQAAFETSRRASVQQAMGIDRGIQQAYGRINRDETEAAEHQQASLDEERKFTQENEQMKEQDLDLAGPTGVGDYGYGYGYAPYGYAPLAPIHNHYHFHY